MRGFVIAIALMLPLAGCSKKKTTGGGGAAPSAKDAAKVDALRAAWGADANCQILVTCCSAVRGTNFEQTLTPICNEVKTKLVDFAERVKGMTDPASLASDCKNRVMGVAMMGNQSNPLPPACLAP